MNSNATLKIPIENSVDDEPHSGQDREDVSEELQRDKTENVMKITTQTTVAR